MPVIHTDSGETAVKCTEIDATIASARTPDKAAYCDQDLFEQEREEIFRKSWLALPPMAAGMPAVQPHTLLEGFLDEPLVFTRDAQGQEHLLSNVCTHRGMLLVCEASAAKRLRCRYHGRRFDLDGQLEAAPGFEGAEDFPSKRDDLPRLSIGRWGPVRFTSLCPSQSFDEWMGPTMPWLQGLELSALRLDPESSQTYTVQANWKLYLDNYLEGFHIPTVHKGLAAELSAGGYETVCIENGSVQIGRVGPDAPTLKLAADHPLSGQNIGALYFHLFPNTLINVYPWGVSMNHINPTAVDQTEVVFRSYVWAPELRTLGAGADLHQVELEDEEVVEAVQRGIRASLYTTGRYAPMHEQAVHHFHRLWSQKIQ